MTLKMEALSSCEMSVDFHQTKRRQIPEYSILCIIKLKETTNQSFRFQTQLCQLNITAEDTNIEVLSIEISNVLAKIPVQNRCNNALKHYVAGVLIPWSADATNASLQVCADERQHLEYGLQGVTNTLSCVLQPLLR